jgi:hypothetical protein
MLTVRAPFPDVQARVMVGEAKVAWVLSHWVLLSCWLVDRLAMWPSCVLLCNVIGSQVLQPHLAFVLRGALGFLFVDCGLLLGVCATAVRSDSRTAIGLLYSAHGGRIAFLCWSLPGALLCAWNSPQQVAGFVAIVLAFCTLAPTLRHHSSHGFEVRFSIGFKNLVAHRQRDSGGWRLSEV